VSSAITVSGRTLDDALSRACEQLRVRVGELHYEITAEGGGDVTIEAEVDPVAVLGLFLTETFGAGKLDLRVRLQMDDGVLRGNLSGDDVHVLTMGSGRGLDALQYLCNRVLAHRQDERPAVQLDVGDYKARRAHDLGGRALDAADEVARSGRPVTLGPLTPAARREIHIALRDDRRVETESHGTGFLKRVVVRPRGRR
jgi:spoIIIJ-associated protein